MVAPHPGLPRIITGFIRGAYVGGLWGAFFHRYDIPKQPSNGLAGSGGEAGNEIVSRRQSLIQAAKMRTCK